jgi:hypothetical protein
VAATPAGLYWKLLGSQLGFKRLFETIRLATVTYRETSGKQTRETGNRRGEMMLTDSFEYLSTPDIFMSANTEDCAGSCVLE